MNTISVSLLEQSTWASKSYGKLRIGNLQNYLKVILQSTQHLGINSIQFRAGAVQLLQTFKGK